MIVDRIRRMRERGEDGFALVFALMVTTLVTVAVATTLTITAPNILSSKNTQDIAAAMLAAQSGVNDAVAYLTGVPACRSETRICPQALGASSSQLGRSSTLGTNQSFRWTTGSSATSDGYVRVTSVGSESGVNRTLVADLSLNPSILAYGYYSDYESQAPTFLNAYWGPRSVYVSDSTTYNDINNNYAGSSNAPGAITWNGAATGPTNYSDSICAQHWYSDGTSSPGRGNATNGSTWEETGTINGTSIVDRNTCDLVFTAGMTENGPTYSRDAFDIANGTGSGPVFNQPVYTLWGYTGKNTPAVTAATPWRQSDGTGNDLLPNSPYKPAVATQDITLPATIGTDGIEDNSCVYYGPTRVVLNGNGTATITSPDTTAAVPGADSQCYPSNLGSSGILQYSLNYAQYGAGTIYVKNDTVPSTGVWPTTSLTSTSTPSASNEVFYYPATGGTLTDPNLAANTSSAPSTGCAALKYSATAAALCAWTGVNSTTDATSSTGWTATSSTAKCNSLTTSSTYRQAFECDWANDYNAGVIPPTTGYATIRGEIQSDINAGKCTSGTSSAQATCLAGLATTYLNTMNLNSNVRYTVTSSVGTAVNSSTTLGSSPTTAVANDSLFTTNVSPATVTASVTPITVTVSRSTYTRSAWSSAVPQFTFTSTQTVNSFAAAGGASYFPNSLDVTQYATGSTAAGVAAGSLGTSQPGDLYVQGVNQGTLSLVAQNNVEVTGDITKGSGLDQSATNPIDITAGNDIRIYHPVTCADQTAADIDATTAGWCPNDITGIYSGSLLNSDGSFTAQHPAAQYTNINSIGNRTIDAALFTLTGSLRTDNYNRGVFVGNLVVNGGIYQSHRGANGVTWGNSGGGTSGRSGTSLNYSYVDLQRASLPYAPSASYSTNPRVWNIVSLSAGTS